MIEAARLRAGKQRKCDDAHGFLGVVAAVAVRHPGCAKNLQFTKKRLDKVWREATERDKKQQHQQPAENKPGNRRCDHWHNNFWPHAGIPFYDRPIAACRSQRCAAKSADQRMARARGQSEPPGGDIPGEGGDERAKHRRHCDNVGIH